LSARLPEHRRSGDHGLGMASSPRDPRRYDTDVTDEQWAWLEGLLP
jgi:hypothetical protein